VERRIGRLDSSHATEWALEAAGVVRSELERLAGLVEDFLAFARPQAVRLSSGDMCETVKTVALLLELELRSAGVQFRVEGEGPVVARFDEERIKQVLLNLIRNAIEAVGRGGEIAQVCPPTSTSSSRSAPPRKEGPDSDCRSCTASSLITAATSR